MSNLIGKTAVMAVALTSALALTACNVEKTQEGELPDVAVEGGALPAYDVETPEVNVETKTVPVEVPVIDVETADEPDTEVMDETDSSADDEVGDAAEDGVG